MKLPQILLVFVTALLPICSLSAQTLPKIALSKDSSVYIKPSFRVQTWASLPMLIGTEVYGEQKDYIFDVSLRRVRLGLNGKLGNNTFFNFSVGGNNLNYISGRNFALRVLDAHIDYSFGKWLQLGFGKSNWHAASRADARSTKSNIALDAPVFNLSTVNHVDDLIRLLGVYAKGQVANFDYRIGVHNTYSIQSTNLYNGDIRKEYATYSDASPALRYSGYLKYHFLEEESNQGAFNAMTNLGKRRILSFGIGYKQQNSLTWTLSTQNDTAYHDLKQFAVDLLYDVPVGDRGGALTAYATYIYLDQGTNYIRNIGLNNPATGVVSEDRSFAGRGNSFPMMGSGDTYFLQLGYLIGQGIFGGDIGRLQPNVSVQYTNFERLSDAMLVYDVAVNIFLRGHNSKFTANYQSRPIFYARENGIFHEGRRGMWVFQYQIAL